MQPIIKIQKAKKHFQVGGAIVKAINGISVDIQKGEFLAIIGASGSGKSTLMNLIGSLDYPTEGNVYLDNMDISHATESELAQIRGRKIGFIFQTFNLIPSLTALGNVALPMFFQNIPRLLRKERAISLLQQVGLGNRLDHLPSQLSGGERQRVAIARALINDPEIILADEPTGNLDSKTGKEIINLIASFHNKGKTVILITHDHEIAQKAQRIINLKDGLILS